MQARERLREARVGPLASFLPTAVFLVGCGTILAKNSWYYFEESPTAICQKICNGMSFAAAPMLARYISDHSSPASRVAILGSEPEIYFYAHRHAASGYIHMSDISSAALHAPAMKQEMECALLQQPRCPPWQRTAQSQGGAQGF